MALLGKVLSALSFSLLLVPLLLAVLYGMAWWTARQGKPAVRRWTIAASTAMLLISVPQFVAVGYAVRYGERLSAIPVGFALLPVACFLIGLLGLIAFASRDSAASWVARTAPPPRIAGDGTSAFLDGAVTAGASIVYILAVRQWHVWAFAHQMRFRLSLLQVCFALLITTVLHELGHAGVGMRMGMKLLSFRVGPFDWSADGGKIKFKFTPAKLLSAEGSVSLVPQRPNQSRWIEIAMIAAGPVANLLTGLIAFGLAVTAKGRAYEPALAMLVLLATLGLLAFAVNLLPLRPEGLYSDGANIYQNLKGGPWADFRAAIAAVLSTTVTPSRPRDFDIETIQRAAQTFTQGRQAVLLRMIASSYYLDRAEFSKAAEAIADAEAAYDMAPWAIPPGLCMSFAFRIALLEGDAVRARVWWQRAQAHNPSQGVNYWLANSALLRAENRLDEARAALEQASRVTAEAPACGDGDFDRYLCSLLGHAKYQAPVHA
jgi:hypothetical protein